MIIFFLFKDEVKEIKFKIDQVRQYMGSDNIENIPTEDYMWSFRRKTLMLIFFDQEVEEHYGWDNVIRLSIFFLFFISNWSKSNFFL